MWSIKLYLKLKIDKQMIVSRTIKLIYAFDLFDEMQYCCTNTSQLKRTHHIQQIFVIYTVIYRDYDIFKKKSNFNSIYTSLMWNYLNIYQYYSQFKLEGILRVTFSSVFSIWLFLFKLVTSAMINKMGQLMPPIGCDPLCHFHGRI